MSSNSPKSLAMKCPCGILFEGVMNERIDRLYAERTKLLLLSMGVSDPKKSREVEQKAQKVLERAQNMEIQAIRGPGNED